MSHSAPFIFVFMVIFLVFIFIISNNRKRLKEVTDLPTFKQYIAQHPEAKKQGKVHCHECDSSNIYLWWLHGPQVGSGPKKHICRTRIAVINRCCVLTCMSVPDRSIIL